MAFVFPEDKADFTAPNGVTYAWDGNKWRTKKYALNDEKLAEYLPKKNPAAIGQLTVSPVDWMEQSKFCVTNGSSAYFILKPSSTAEKSQIQYWGLTEGDRDLATVGYVKSQLSVGGEQPDLTAFLKGNAVNDVTTAFRVKANGKTLISSSGNELGLFNVKAPAEAAHAATKGYVDTKLAEVGSGPTTKYDGNRYCKSGVSTTTLETGDVMFLNDQLVSEQTPSKTAAIALPIAEFNWDSCAKSGIIKANNGAYNAGYYQVYELKENAGRNMIVYVKPLVVDDSVRHEEGGAPCYFQGVFFK